MLYMLIAKCYISKKFPKLYQGKRYNDGIPSMHNNAVYNAVYKEVYEENIHESVQS